MGLNTLGILPYWRTPHRTKGEGNCVDTMGFFKKIIEYVAKHILKSIEARQTFIYLVVGTFHYECLNLNTHLFLPSQSTFFMLFRNIFIFEIPMIILVIDSLRECLQLCLTMLSAVSMKNVRICSSYKKWNEIPHTRLAYMLRPKH